MEPRDIENPIAEKDFRHQLKQDKMINYIVTLTYSFSAGRDFTAVMLLSASSEEEAIEFAQQQLLEKAKGARVNHSIGFEVGNSLTN